MRNRYILLADVCLIPIVAYAAFALGFDWCSPKAVRKSLEGNEECRIE